MNSIGLEYGKWLSSYSWTHIATIRRHFRLTEFNIRPMIKRLFSYRSVKKIFYAIERDKNDNMTHAHLLIEASGGYDRKRVANELGINPKAVSYFDEVKDAKAVANYFTKNIGNPFSFHDIHIKD